MAEWLAILPDAAILYDAESLQILASNPSACKLYGYTPTELLTHKVLDLSGEPARTRRRLAEVQTTKFEARIIIQHRRKDGSKFPAEVVSQLFELDGRGVFLSLVRDYTVQKIIEDQLQNLNERMSVTLRALPDLIFELDQSGKFVDYYASRPDLLYVPFEEQIGRQIEDVLPVGPAADIRAALDEAIRTGSGQSATYCLELAGKTHYFEMSVSRKSSQSDYSATYIALIRDVTDRALIEQSLAESENRYRRLVDLSSDVIFAADPEGVITYINPTALEFSGYSQDELLGRSYIDLIAPDWVPAAREMFETQLRLQMRESILEYELLRKDGSRLWVEQNTSLVFKGLVVDSFQGIIRNIAARKARELALASEMEEVVEAARTDALTGLLNRRAILDLADHELENSIKAARPLVIVIADLDNLKGINDQYGHAQGDAYIQLFTVNITDSIRHSDSVGRIGGDEFLIILPNTSTEGSQRAVTKILNSSRKTALGLPDGGSFPLHASYGLAIFDPQAESLDLTELLEQADKALYAAKQRGKGTFALYTKEMEKSTRPNRGQ